MPTERAMKAAEEWLVGQLPVLSMIPNDRRERLARVTKRRAERLAAHIDTYCPEQPGHEKMKEACEGLVILCASFEAQCREGQQHACKTNRGFEAEMYKETGVMFRNVGSDLRSALAATKEEPSHDG